MGPLPGLGFYQSSGGSGSPVIITGEALVVVVAPATITATVSRNRITLTIPPG